MAFEVPPGWVVISVPRKLGGSVKVADKYYVHTESEVRLRSTKEVSRFLACHAEHPELSMKDCKRAMMNGGRAPVPRTRTSGAGMSTAASRNTGVARPRKQQVLLVAGAETSACSQRALESSTRHRCPLPGAACACGLCDAL